MTTADLAAHDLIIRSCPVRPTTRRIAALARTADVRVASMWGAGRLVYVTDDGWAGVHLDGEYGISGAPRVDEYPAPLVEVER